MHTIGKSMHWEFFFSAINFINSGGPLVKIVA